MFSDCSKRIDKVNAMKKSIVNLIVMISCLLVSGCLEKNADLAVTPVPPPPVQETEITFQEKAITFLDKAGTDLEPELQVGVELAQMVKHNLVPVEPYINLNPSDLDLEHPATLDLFSLQNMVILEVAASPDNIFAHRMLTESRDTIGRFDIRDDRIAYLVRDPEPEEAAMMKEDILTVLSKKNRSKIPLKHKKDFRNIVRAFQDANGLKPDGLFGKNTATAMASQMSVVDIKAVTSKIVYPKQPRTRIFLVPQALLNSEPEKFYRGFASLEAVQMNALGPEGFANLAKKGQSFGAFVFFLDRVDPHRPITIGLSEYKKRSDGPMGEKWHSVPGKWPVVVETFRVNQFPKTTLANLYLNVFIHDDKKARCVATHQIQ